VVLDRAVAEIELSSDLGVRQSLGRQTCNLRFLGRELVPRVDRAFSDRFAGGQQLAAGALVESQVQFQLDSSEASPTPVSPHPDFVRSRRTPTFGGGVSLLVRRGRAHPTACIAVRRVGLPYGVDVQHARRRLQPERVR
jgi:hypothetical protein